MKKSWNLPRMKVCKTLFGRINRPSQSCSRFARLGCEICLTLLDAKKCSSPYGCRSWNIFLLSVGQVLLSPLRRRYLHQCQLQCLLVLRFDPRKRVQSSKLPVFRNCAGFSIVAPAFLCRLLSRFLFLLYLPQIQALSTFSFASPFPYVLREDQTAESVRPQFWTAHFRARFLRVWHVLRLNGTTPVSRACSFPPQFVLRTAAMRRFARLIARLPAVWIFNK